MMNLSNVKTYLINYFGENPFDYNKYKQPVKNENKNKNQNESPYILSESCTTRNIKLDLSNTTTVVNDDGSTTTTYYDGTTVTTNPDGTTTTTLSDGTTITENEDGSVTTEYSDGTTTTEDEDGNKDTEYSNGVHIMEDSEGNIISIEDSDGEMVDFTTLEPIFSKFRGMQHTSETIRYLLDVYKLYYRDELKQYKMEEYDSYLMEYITAKVVYDSNNTEYNVIQQSTLYNDIFTVLDDLQKTQSNNNTANNNTGNNTGTEGFQNKSVEGFQNEMTPSRLVKSVKFWNYLTTIINAKNASCPRFPLTMTTLKTLYNNDEVIVKDENRIGQLTLTRNNMGDLTIQSLQDLTDLVDAYTDEPIWGDKMKTLNKDLLKKDVKMGGSKISQGESIHYGNFELYVGKKSIEFVVNHYDDTNLKNQMNTYVIPRSKYEDINLFSWVCKLPDSGDLYDPSIVNPTQKQWWIDNIIPSEQENLCDTDNITEKDEVAYLREFINSRINVYTKDILFENYITDFNEKWNNTVNNFITNCGTCYIKSYFKEYKPDTDPANGICQGPEHCLGVTTQEDCNNKADWAGAKNCTWVPAADAQDTDGTCQGRTALDNDCEDLGTKGECDTYLKGNTKACDWISNESAMNTAGYCYGNTNTVMDQNACIPLRCESDCTTQKNDTGVAQCTWVENTAHATKTGYCEGKTYIGLDSATCVPNATEEDCNGESIAGGCKWVETGMAVGCEIMADKDGVCIGNTTYDYNDCKALNNSVDCNEGPCNWKSGATGICRAKNGTEPGGYAHEYAPCIEFTNKNDCDIQYMGDNICKWEDIHNAANTNNQTEGFQNRNNKNNGNNVEHFTNNPGVCNGRTSVDDVDCQIHTTASGCENQVNLMGLKQCNWNFVCPTDDNNNEDGSSAIEVVYLTPKELEIRKSDPSQIYSIENGGDDENNIDPSGFFTDNLSPEDISAASLSESNFYDFIKKYMGFASAKYLKENDIDTADTPLVGETLEPPIAEPKWTDILEGTDFENLADVMSLYWKYSPGLSNNQVTEDINVGDMEDRFGAFQDHTDKESDPTNTSTCIFNIVHPQVNSIDYVEFTETGELTIYSNGIAYPLFIPENNPGEEMYNCRLEIDNIIGPKIVDGNNNLVWGMMTHDTLISDTPLKQNNKNKLKAVLSQMYFNRLCDKDSSQIITASYGGILSKDNSDIGILYGPSSGNNGYYLQTSTKQGAEPDKIKFGNLQLTLYKDRLSFEGLSSYTGKLITIWEYKFSWNTVLRSDASGISGNSNNPEYFVVLYQKMFGMPPEDLDFTTERTDGDLYITLLVNDGTDTMTFNNDYKQINGNEVETISLSQIFNFSTIKGAAFSFDNTGPSLRYANLLIWHPLFNLSNDNILDYFNKYSSVGYLMTDSTNVQAFDLDDINNIEPFTNNNFKNNNKNNNTSKFVYSQPLINNSKPYLKTENKEDCCSEFSKFEKLNTANTLKLPLNKMTETNKIQNEIEQFDNMFGGDYNFYYNKYRCKASQRDCLYGENKTNENKPSNGLFDMIEDRHSILKLVLWCVVLFLIYLVIRRYF
jgi:hypothetical protein